MIYALWGAVNDKFSRATLKNIIKLKWLIEQFNFIIPKKVLAN